MRLSITDEFPLCRTLAVQFTIARDIHKNKIRLLSFLSLIALIGSMHGFGVPRTIGARQNVAARTLGARLAPRRMA
ncbi:hypothetical protein PXJ20_10365 [Paraburkholderia sp. A1RI_3L]|uniref:hypothetical protein n=1 Tax=Paraburkholderia TaxID=1822464 RepID=UPI001268D5E8|nr:MULTISPECIES: hypothetical protein [Paraburkholderia]WEY37542.1 hypothetical protein P2869_10605 [Paraburkholderia sp. SUR17]